MDILNPNGVEVSPAVNIALIDGSSDTKNFLDSVSFSSVQFSQSLATIHLSRLSFEEVSGDLMLYRALLLSRWQELTKCAPFRVKTVRSARLKFDKYKASGGNYILCFNDLLGFRVRVNDYPEIIPSYYRVVDLSGGKEDFDGYRAIHLYYRASNRSYPIEI